MPRQLPDRGVSTPTRRELLATAAGLGAGGVTWATIGTRGVRGATISTDGLSVADASYAAPNGELFSPVVQVDAQWAYEGIDRAAQVLVALLLDGSLVDDVVTTGTAAGADDGVTPLSAPVVDSSAWASADWQATDGDVSHDVTVSLLFEVRDVDGETLASDTAKDTATVTVTDAGPAANASVGGDGTVVFLESADGTPQA
jgi:hypothetical protein